MGHGLRTPITEHNSAGPKSTRHRRLPQRELVPHESLPNTKSVLLAAAGRLPGRRRTRPLRPAAGTQPRHRPRRGQPRLGRRGTRISRLPPELGSGAPRPRASGDHGGGRGAAAEGHDLLLPERAGNPAGASGWSRRFPARTSSTTRAPAPRRRSMRCASRAPSPAATRSSSSKGRGTACTTTGCGARCRPLPPTTRAPSPTRSACRRNRASRCWSRRSTKPRPRSR